MRVTNINIRQYKHVRNLVFTPLPGLNILIGKNNSGKTNILEAILALKDIDLASGGDFTVNGDDQGRPFSVDHGRPTPGISDQAHGHIGHLQDARFGRDTTSETFFSELLGLYEAIESEPEAHELFRRSLQRFFPHLTIRREGSELFFIDEEALPIERLGSGFHQIFTILIYLYHPTLDILLIDEPESHLHPSLIERLRQEFVAAAGRRKQLFISTHSPLFITPRLLPNVFRVTRHDERVEIFPVVRERLDADRLEQEITPDVGEAFFADKVLLLEGVADKLMMRGLLDRFYHGSETIKVIDVGGKDNMTVYRDLCRAFGIRYYILLDADAMKGDKLALIRELLTAAGKHHGSPPEQRQWLKSKRLFVLPHGPLEAHYPRKYQNRDLTKPLAALRASRLMTEAEYHHEASALAEVVSVMTESDQPVRAILKPS